MDKYYRVKKNTFLWKEGAILRLNQKYGHDGGYEPIEDIWDVIPSCKDDYVSATIIEHPDNSKFFERIYPDSVTGKLFKTKDQLLDMYSKAFKGV